MTKLFLKVNSQFDIPFLEQIKVFKKVGFDGFFTPWSSDVPLFANKAEEEGMIYSSIHAPYDLLAYMWIGGREAEECVSQYKRCLEDCARFGVPILVLHPFIEFDKRACPTPEGALRFAPVVERAKELGVELAFENVAGEEYLALIMDTFESVKFCFDAGHEACFNEGYDMLSLYGDRMVINHLHDNFGKTDSPFPDDLHLPLFEGALDFTLVAERLNRVGYHGDLTFEIDRQNKRGSNAHDRFLKMSGEEYVEYIYKGAQRFLELKEKT